VQKTLSCAVAVFCLAACSANHYRKSADKESYAAIAGKTPLVPNMETNFTIEQTDVVSFEQLGSLPAAPDFLGPDAGREAGARVLPLDAALQIAIKHNRAYQSRKEQLYLTALGLTLARHRFTPIFSGGGGGKIAGAVETQRRIDTVVDPISGLPRTVVRDELVEERHVSADGELSVSWLIRDLGQVTASFSTDFLRYITGDPRVVTSSRVGATFIRPLLRNAGYKQQIELLTQAERDLLYDLRSFAQYRKTFSVGVASAYYAVLGNRDTVRNNFLNLSSSRRNAERTRELAKEGRVTQSDLGRLEQQVLSAEGTWNNALRTYKQALDNFKLLQLGVPVNTKLVLDDGELDRLTIHHPNVNVEDAVALGLLARLDYLNAQDRHEDAVRKVALAADALKPQVDLVANGGFVSPPGQTHLAPPPDLARYSWSAGLDVDLPLDRKLERNGYRSALITEKQSARAVEQQADEIRLEVRESWRALDQAKRNYEISELGVELARRRVEEQDLLAELGRAKAQDQVDAQNDLITSKNQRTQALVSHTIDRLQFWANMGILYIKDDGQWQQLNDSDVSKNP